MATLVANTVVSDATGNVFIPLDAGPQADTDVTVIASAAAQIAELQAKLDQQPTPPQPTPAPVLGPATADLPASSVPPGLAPVNPSQPEVGQYVGHGAEAIAVQGHGTFDVDPATGLIVGRRKA